MPSKLPTILLLLGTSVSAFYLLFAHPLSKKFLFPVLTRTKLSGVFPDGLHLRRSYTGYRGVDQGLSGIVGCFSLIVDGRDELTWRFGTWFLPQLAPILIFMFWEAGKANNLLLRMYVSFK